MMTLYYGIVPGIRSVVTADGGVLLDLSRGVCYSLNPVGARIWSLLSAGGRGLTVEAVADDLARQYAVPRPRLEKEIEAFLSAMARKGLVHAFARHSDEMREKRIYARA